MQSSEIYFPSLLEYFQISKSELVWKLAFESGHEVLDTVKTGISQLVMVKWEVCPSTVLTG